MKKGTQAKSFVHSELEERGGVDLVGVEVGADQRDRITGDGVSACVSLRFARDGVKTARGHLKNKGELTWKVKQNGC